MIRKVKVIPVLFMLLLLVVIFMGIEEAVEMTKAVMVLLGGRNEGNQEVNRFDRYNKAPESVNYSVPLDICRYCVKREHYKCCCYKKRNDYARKRNTMQI